VFLVSAISGGIALYRIQLAPALNHLFTGGRVNILLLGSDTDGKGNDPTNGVPLAQTVMIVTVDGQTNSVGMLSIPRDMQVIENGYTEPKLDEVFSHGYTGNTLQEKIAHGAAEMEDVIQNNFSIHIDHYAWVGLDGFVKVIDTAGGIDVDVLHPMVDDTYPDDVGNTNGGIYDYKRVYIAPGPQRLNGVQALEYVRTRHSDLIGDFGRTVRQQQIISQLKIKLATPKTIEKAPDLVQDLNGAVQTDMQLNTVVDLANLARNIDGNNVQHLTLGPPDYAVPSTNGERSGNYLPVCDNIVPAIQKMFNIAYPRCISQGTGNTSSFARTTPPVPSSGATTFNTAKVSEQTQTSPSNSPASPLDARLHGLLDLLFATTFESFDALQI
jgi:LCP family protein required for cell wall assembly